MARKKRKDSSHGGDAQELWLTDSEGSKSGGNFGFNITKAVDKSSIFYGFPSLNAVSSYIENIAGNYELFPKKGDSYLVKYSKLSVIAFNFLRLFANKIDTDLKRADFTELSFGTSDQLIFDLVNSISKPDEIFTPERRANIGYIPDLYRYPIGSGFIYFVKPPGSTHAINKILITKNLTKADVIKIIWDKIGHRLNINFEDDDLNWEYIDAEEEAAQHYLFGSSLKFIETFKEECKRFRDKKLSRSYLLIGKPGTGKTSIISSVVKGLNEKVLVVGSLEYNDDVETFQNLCLHMKPDYVVFDDVDRSPDSPSFVKAFLMLLEKIKDNNSNTIFLFTANSFSGILDVEAITRRGRVDQIFEIHEPDDDDRKEIIENYAKNFKLDLPDDKVKRCVELSDGMTGADLKEICLQLQFGSIEDVFARAQEMETLRKKYPNTESLSSLKNILLKNGNIETHE